MMVDRNLFRAVDLRLRQATPHQADHRFGGVSVRLLGDFGQLPPVMDRPMFDVDVSLAFVVSQVPGLEAASRLHAHRHQEFALDITFVALSRAAYQQDVMLNPTDPAAAQRSRLLRINTREGQNRREKIDDLL